MIFKMLMMILLIVVLTVLQLWLQLGLVKWIFKKDDAYIWNNVWIGQKITHLIAASLVSYMGVKTMMGYWNDF